MAKQYLPFSTRFLDIPAVVYPAKDDGEIPQAYRRDNSESIQDYLREVLPLYSTRLEGSGMLILYVWNDGKIPMVDIWKVMRNSISDDSGFLYDGFTLK